MPNQAAADNSSRPFTTREKLINAIPLLLVAVVIVFFAYSCHQNRSLTAVTTAFIQDYYTTNSAFDTQLQDCLGKKISIDDYRQILRDTQLPALQKLKVQIQDLPADCQAYVICFDESAQVVDLKIELANLILNQKDDLKDKQLEQFFKLLNDISELQKKIHAENQKYHSGN